MLNLIPKYKYLGYLDEDHLIKDAHNRIRRIPPTCDICGCPEGYNLIKKYYIVFSLDVDYLLKCKCCEEIIELDYEEYDLVKKIAKLNLNFENKKVTQNDYMNKLEKLL